MGQPSYLYYFRHSTPAQRARDLAAFHASELPYIFGQVGESAALGPELAARSAHERRIAALGGDVELLGFASCATAFPRRRTCRPGRASLRTSAAISILTNAPRPSAICIPVPLPSPTS